MRIPVLVELRARGDYPLFALDAIGLLIVEALDHRHLIEHRYAIALLHTGSRGRETFEHETERISSRTAPAAQIRRSEDHAGSGRRAAAEPKHSSDNAGPNLRGAHRRDCRWLRPTSKKILAVANR
jgi:hypothetical protein